MTAGLKLISANESRGQGSWSQDDFDVVLADTGERVGRIFAKLATGGGRQWFWGLGFPHTLNARQPYYGTVETKKAAKQAFADRWRGQAQADT
jgi:hypothetical protein